MSFDILSELGVNGAMAGASMLNRPAEEYENDAQIESLWAMKAFEHAEVYFNLICSIDPKLLKLTPNDDQVYNRFREEFPDFKIDKLDSQTLKSPAAKEKWRPFCNEFEKIVEDFNYGTLIRLNCDDEYSEPNSIIVTRIQFYAIEIARNREGANDIIKSKFKPKPRQKEDGDLRYNGPYLAQAFLTFLEEFLRNHVSSVPQVYTTKPNCDYKFHLNSVQNNLLEDLKSVCNSAPSKVKEVKFHKNSYFINLERKFAFQSVLKDVSTIGDDYGKYPKKNAQFMITSFNSSENALEELRSFLIGLCYAQLLDFAGYDTSLIMDIDREKVEKITKFCSFNQYIESKVQRHINEILERAATSRYKVDDTNITLDTKSYMDDKSKDNYDPNIKLISLREKEKVTNTVYKTAKWKSLIESNPEVVNVLEIIPQRFQFHSEQVFLLYNMLNFKPIDRKYIVHGSLKVSNTESSNISINELHKLKEKTLLEETLYKNGLSSETPSLLNMVDKLTDASLKIEILNVSTLSNVNLELQTKNYSGPKGTFVMYNYARLSMILTKFDEMSKQGKYPKLPAHKDINFDHLVHNMEWKLLFNYVFQFPSLIKKITDLTCTNVAAIHKVTHFLLSISEDFSAYYSKIHILGEPKAHLMEVMFARLHLLKAVKQVMKNALYLLNIQEIEVM